MPNSSTELQPCLQLKAESSFSARLLPLGGIKLPERNYWWPDGLDGEELCLFAAPSLVREAARQVACASQTRNTSLLQEEIILPIPPDETSAQVLLRQDSCWAWKWMTNSSKD